MRLTVLSSVACPDRPTFSTQPNKRHGLGNVIEYKLFMLIFSTTLSEVFIVVSSIQRNIVFMYKHRHVKCLIFEKFSNIKFRKNPFIGSRVVPSGQPDGLMGRQTDRHDEANSRFFFNFVSAPKTVSTHDGKITRDK